MTYYHKTVLLRETIDFIDPKPGGVYVDATLGGGGHLGEIIRRTHGEGTFIGIDQDEMAILNAKENFPAMSQNLYIAHDNFRNIENIIRGYGLTGIDGIVFDLGVSSHQLDERSRGFSYMNDAQLDMRMDRRSPVSARDVVNNSSKQDLKNIIKKYGEESWAGRIADFICEARKRQEINTTGDLVKIIKAAIPAGARRKGGHPAKKTFQALRIYVNDELGILKNTIKDAVKMLNPHGRISVITFHSLEDRIVKETYRFLAADCICPKESIICTCDHVKTLKVLTSKPICPTSDEIEKNPRARSAKLRASEKLPVLKKRRNE